MAECALGVEIAEDRSRCSVAKAYRTGERITAELVWYEPPAGAVTFLGALYMSADPVAVALDPRSQAATLAAPLAEQGVIVTRLSTEQVAVAHGEFMDLVSGGGLRHLDQAPLTAAVRGAQTRPLAGARALERRVMVDQSPLVAAEIAIFAFARWEELSTPGAWAL